MRTAVKRASALSHVFRDVIPDLLGGFGFVVGEISSEKAVGERRFDPSLDQLGFVLEVE